MGCVVLFFKYILDHEAWFLDLSISFHMNPHREWFCEYEIFDGGDVFLGDDLVAIIIERGKFKLNLMGGRNGTLPIVIHILGLAKILIFVSKMSDVGVKKMFEKDTSRMV